MSTNNDATNTTIIQLAPPVANNVNVDDFKELPWKQTNLKLIEVLFKSVQTKLKTEESKRLWLEVNEIFFDQPELNNFKCLKIVGQYC
jgi:hypothetical protein